MDLLILHLSDIHFKESSDNYKEIVEALVKCVKKHSQNIENILIIITGDIAYSGLKIEYLIAKDFIEKLKEKIHKELNIENIKFAIVPGNHDIDYNNKPITSDELNKIKKDNSYEENISNELAKLKEFFSFANIFGLFKDGSKKLIDKIEFKTKNTSIQINLINTAIFSSKDEEDQGFHYLTNKDIEYLSQQSDADYIFSLIHHSYHWYDDKIKKHLEKTLFQNSDLIFVGHEHYKDEFRIENKDSIINILNGGEFYNGENWSNSSFNLFKINLITRDYEEFTYIFDSQNNIYINSENDIKKGHIEKNRSNCLGMIPSKTFLDDFLQDKKYGFYFMDYFVFPLLEHIPNCDEKQDNSIYDFKQFDAILNQYKRLLVRGGYCSGKTIFLKYVFNVLKEKFFVIYIDAKYIKSDNIEKIIKLRFKEIYFDDNLYFQKFLQTDNSQKVILVDDFDNIDNKYLELFLNYIESNFDKIILTTVNKVNLNIQENIHWKKYTNSYRNYKICHFYENKRNELVSKIVNLLKKTNYNSEYVIKNLCDSLSMQKRFFIFNPDFIVQFALYYCNNVGESSKSDGEIFSKVFEANLINLIRPYSKQIKTDKIFIILGKIAYKMHIESYYPMSYSSVCKAIEEYNEIYNSNINEHEFLEMLISSKVIVVEENNISFYSKTYFAYFVALEIKRKWVEEQDSSEFQNLLKNAYIGINAEILLFVTYIIGNNVLIRKIMDKTMEYTRDWKVFDFEDIDIDYLNDVRTPLLLTKPVSEKDIEDYKKDKIETEKKEIDTMEKYNISPIDNYNKSEIDIEDQLVRALSLMIIIARILPNFEYMMYKEDKKECVKLIYELPLRIFYIWANQIDNIKNHLLEDIKHFPEREFRNQTKLFTDEQAINILRWESISILMDMINISIGYSTKDNTLRYIDYYENLNKLSFKFERLVSLAKRDNVGTFAKEVVELYSKTNIKMVKLMIKLLSRHFMISSNKINREVMQKLNAKLFDGQINEQHLLSQRVLNKTKF